MRSIGSSSRPVASPEMRARVPRRGRTQWRQVGLQALQGLAAVVDAALDADDVEPFLEQFNGRQHALPVQAVRIETVGSVVAGHDEGHAVAEQPEQKSFQDHRVGDVGEVELVEADQPITPRHAPCHLVERILHAAQVAQFAMDPAHELVEMQAALTAYRHGFEEAVHDETLSAPDAAMQPDAAWDLRPEDHPPQDVPPNHLEVLEFVRKALQPLDGRQLRRICPGSRVPRARLKTFGERQSYMFSDRLSVASAASRMTSESDGCGWPMRAMSSAAALNSIATTASAIRSEALEPMMCTPRFRRWLHRQ
jgi:hypothetical protein